VIIQNYAQLSTTPARKDALEIINAGIEAVLVKPALHKYLKRRGNTLHIHKERIDLSHIKNLYVLGAGKASAEMAEAVEEIVGSRITSGIVIDTQNKKLKHIEAVKGTHPFPSSINVKATSRIKELVQKAGREDLIINLLSGGGSALLADSRMPINQYAEVTSLLLKRGATIQEINTIRKHSSYLKGGQLAEYASPARIVSFILSDVMTNELAVIASGPTVGDPTTLKEAENLRKKYRLPEMMFVETPKQTSSNATNILIGTNLTAVEAMQQKARKLGYKTLIETLQLKGEARVVGKKLAQKIKPNQALIAAGEPTVTVKGKGMGGRNQELILSASRLIKSGAIISCSTDGVDFITQAAGGIVDETTKIEAEEKGLDPNKYLENNDSYNFLKQVNGLIKTGKTETNIGDIVLVLGPKL
jgi:glycerate-2-kinase